jgi:hypothetical protein
MEEKPALYIFIWVDNRCRVNTDSVSNRINQKPTILLFIEQILIFSHSKVRESQESTCVAIFNSNESSLAPGGSPWVLDQPSLFSCVKSEGSCGVICGCRAVAEDTSSVIFPIGCVDVDAYGGLSDSTLVGGLVGLDNLWSTDLIGTWFQLAWLLLSNLVNIGDQITYG